MIFTIALAVRLTAFFGLGFHRLPAQDDESKYLGMALSLYQDGTLAVKPGGLPTSWAGPGFPALLLPAMAIPSDNPLLWARLLNLLCGALLAALTYYIGLIFFDKVVGILGGLIVVFYPMLIYWNMFLLTEIAYGVGLLLIIIITHRAYVLQKVRCFFELGVTLALVSLIRPIGMMLAPLLLLWSWGVARGNRWFRIRSGIVICGTFCMAVLPWSIRNFQVHGKLIPLNTNGGVNLLVGNNPVVWNDEELRGRFMYFTNPRLKNFFPEAWMPALREIELDQIAQQRALRFILDNPWRFILESFYKIRSLFRVTIIGGGMWINAVLWLTYGLLLPFFIAGLGLNLREWRRYAPLYLVIIATTLSAAIFFGSPRIRLPIEPIIILFGVVGFRALIIRLARLRFF